MLERLTARIVRIATKFSTPHAAWQGMDRQVRKILTLAERLSKPDVHDPAKMRRIYRRQHLLWNIETDHSVSTEDQALGDQLSLRWYWLGKQEGKGQCLVYFHGGGMVLGDLESHDRFCRFIAKMRKMTVVAVHYRRAPEHPYPAAIEDAITAWNSVVEQWQEQGGSLQHLGIGGDGSGATLATVVCQKSAQPQAQEVDIVLPVLKPVWQWLICPETDSTDGSSESWITNSQDLFLTSQLVERCRNHYLPDVDQRNRPDVSPLHAPAELLAQLPATVVITAGFDPLRDQGLNYVRKLKLAGVPVASHHEPTMPHGYIHLGGCSDKALVALDKAVSMIDTIALQARRTMPVETPGFVPRFQGPPVNLQVQKLPKQKQAGSDAEVAQEPGTSNNPV